jgi:hypothetical protein
MKPDSLADASALMLGVHSELMNGRHPGAREVLAIVARVGGLRHDGSDQLGAVLNDEAVAASNSFRGDLRRLIDGRVVQPHRAEPGIRPMQQGGEFDDGIRLSELSEMKHGEAWGPG